MSDVQSIPCPQCAHDLRGIPAVDDLYRCPECGTISDLRTLARVRKHRRLTWARLMIAGLLSLLVLLMILWNAR